VADAAALTPFRKSLRSGSLNSRTVNQEHAEEAHMHRSVWGVALLLVVGAQADRLCAQAAPAAQPTRAQIIAAAMIIMQEARYCTLVTLGGDGHPQARVVDPFPPDSDLTIWMATNPVTRKVQEIRRDPRVTLLCFNPAKFEYVTVIGTAMLDTDPAHKAAHWKAAWSGMYKDENRGEDYLLLRVTPSRLEVVSGRNGLRNDPKTGRPVIVDIPH
jgi:general stress protein 26